jgi:small-conductance mechanosensitive channel
VLSLLLVQQPTPPAAPSTSMERLLASLGADGGTIALTALAANVFVTVLLVLTLVLLRRGVLRFVEPRVEDARTRYQWAKITANVAIVVALLAIAAIWLSGLGSLGTFLGLLSAGLAIALKDVVADLAAWVFIVVRRPFEMGDRVQIGTNAGDVVDLGLFQFTLLEIGNWVEADQSTGRVIHVPNALVFTIPLANYTQEFEYVWHELSVTVTFESDWRRARDTLQRIVTEVAGPHADAAEVQIRRATRKFFIHYTHTDPVVYMELRPNGVMLTLRFLCPARQRRQTAAVLYEAILDAFQQEERIQLAYPTSRVFRNTEEGKTPLKEVASPAGGPAEMLPMEHGN